MNLFVLSDPSYNESNYMPLQMWKDQFGNEIKTDGVKYELQESNRKLIILKVNESDEGIYTCVGENSFGRVQEQVMLDIYCK